jgi:cis-3-alkyl-4-acyloxetan-2-one decarboxylase
MAAPRPNFVDYPFADQTLEIKGVRMHYVDEGPREAPPVVMVHGNPTWSYYYRHLITALRGTHRVIAPDHIGMGLSEKPDESRYEFTLSRRVADLEALLDSLKLTQPITLVVHDWGGMIGMTYAVRHLERIARIVVLNTGGFSLPKTTKMPWQLNVTRLPLLGAILVRGFNAFSAGAVRDCVIHPMTKATSHGYLAPYDSWHHRLAVHRFIQDIPLRAGDRAFATVAETESRLASLAHVPMLICWGMHDFVFDVHFLNRWIELFPAADVHRFEDAGHYVLEDAGDRILLLVQKFVAQSTAQVAV